MLFEALLRFGADPDSISLPEDAKMRSLVLEYGRSRFSAGEFTKVLSGYSPDWKNASIMLLRGADPAEKDPVTGDNAFHRAAGLGNAGFLKLLIDSGKPGWDAVNKSGLTPYQLAVTSGKGETAHVLKKSFPESKAAGAMYNSGALFRAIETNDPGETAYRLMLDSDPLKLNAMQLNALQYAAKIGSVKAAQVLLENKVHPDNCKGDRPLKFAVENADSELFVLLVSHGADPDIETIDMFGRKTLLFTEIFRRFSGSPDRMYQCFEAMIEHKWDPQVRTPSGDTPLEWMEKWNAGSEEIKKLLRESIVNSGGAVDEVNSEDF
jgi:ankyrin repeat protein